MHYYQFNIGDYASHTIGLSLLEDLAYRRLIDRYYLDEQPLNGRSTDVARLIGMREQVDEVTYVLERFFEETPQGWVHHRIEKELAEFKEKREKASAAGKASARSRAKAASKAGKPTPVEQTLNERSTDVQPTNNHKPSTNNQLKTHGACEEKYSGEFEAAWALYPKREGSNPKNRAYASWKARLADGATVEAMTAGLKRYAAFCAAKGSVGTSFVMQGQRFFGPSKEYENDWSVEPVGTGPPGAGYQTAQERRAARNAEIFDYEKATTF